MSVTARLDAHEDKPEKDKSIPQEVHVHLRMLVRNRGTDFPVSFNIYNTEMWYLRSREKERESRREQGEGRERASCRPLLHAPKCRQAMVLELHPDSL